MFGTDLLRQRVQATPERTALAATDSGREWTYRDLDRTVEELAGRLQYILDRADNDQPERLGVVLSTRPAFVFAAHASLRLGVSLVGLNARLSPEELATQIGRAGPATVLCGEQTERLAMAAVDALDQPESERQATKPAVFTVDEPETGAQPLPNNRQAQSPPDNTHEQSPPNDTSAWSHPDNTHVGSKPSETSGGRLDWSAGGHEPEDTAVILFTSGTTGQPKGVQLTPSNLIASAVASALRLGVTPGDRWLCCLPMYHMGGLAPVFRSALYGTTLVLQSEFEAAETAKIIAHEGITGVSLVPTQLRRLFEAGFGRGELSAETVRAVLLGGAPAQPSLLERALDASVPVYPTYGLTETASQVATASPSQIAADPETVGQPLFGTRIRIVSVPDEERERQLLGPGERGEIVLDGPTVTKGYLDAEKTRKAFSAFGFHTGDIGRIDEDGRLRVLGRLDETIITGGELVSPAQVARHLRSHAAVEDVAVLGLPDEEWGQRVVALVVPAGSGGDREPREQIEEHCEGLADYKRPKAIEFVDSLPRTHSGTVDRERAQSLFDGEDSE